ncbi:MAG: nicotinate-nucleotide adenylyltransferase [Cytophagales bacterium]|nr:MAG: nicotinate-nucleotide adenylyltransferase [Cytophagales bacterium]
MKKVGLYFGSFNPIHVGHLIIAQTILEQSDLTEIWFVVSPHNPLKKSSTLLHEFDRYEMVRLAIHDNFSFRVSDIEFSMPKPSYTIDTLTYLQDKHPNQEFVLIIGEDNLDQLPNWKNHEQILNNFSLYVYPRFGAKTSELIKHSKVKVFEAPLLAISATYIRKLINQQRSVKYLLPKEVEEYIVAKKFWI